MRRTPRLAFAHVALWAVALADPAPARANGVVSHVHISNLAVPLLPPGDLRSLLEDPALAEAYRAGSVFPDTGYAAGDAYGEMAHWEPFTDALVRHIREEHPPPFASEEARRLVAFLLGQASHGMADQWFDSLFMARVRQIDGTDATLDTYAESWLVVEHDPDARIAGWLEASVIDRVFADRLGYRPTPAVLEDGMETVVLAIAVIYDLAPALYPSTWMSLPWAATHYHLAPGDAPGGLPHIAAVVALYWQVLWERLHATDEMTDSFLTSWPADGQVNVEVDHARVETRIAVAFGHGIDRVTLTPAIVRLLERGGEAVPARVRFIYGSDFANVVLVEPEVDLRYDTEHVVELGTGLRAMDGRTLPDAVSLSFRTRCAPDRLADCPPLPEPWEVPDGPPDLPDAGADAGDDAGGPDGDGGDAGTLDAGDGGDPAADAGADADASDGHMLLWAGGGGGCAGCVAAGAPGAAPAALIVALAVLVALARRRG
jgi:hypothetical protein